MDILKVAVAAVILVVDAVKTNFIYCQVGAGLLKIVEPAQPRFLDDS